ncbi:MAG: proline dehydrogenase family protein [Pirellulales bacterium]|nr:proline dehydrogenase family protein [Pirellulales bacterium]
MSTTQLLPTPGLAQQSPRIAARTLEIGRELLAAAQQARPRWWQRTWWEERFLTAALADEKVKVEAFRFVDVLPMLRENRQILAQLREHFAAIRDRVPWYVGVPFSLFSGNVLTGIPLAAVVRWNVLAQARKFIAGTNVAEVLATARRERQLGRAFTLDLLGEAVTSDADADRYLASYLGMLDQLSNKVQAWPEASLLDQDSHGPIPRVNVSVKLSALDSQFDPIDPAGTTRRVAGRLRELLRLAMQRGAHVHLDMESYRTKDLTLAIARNIFDEPEFRDYPHLGVVIQCYLRSAATDLAELADWAKQRGTPIWVRLVKGAYWDYETIHAGLQGWPVPVWTRKWESDLCYEQLTRYALAQFPHLRLALASHNVRSLAHGLAVAEELGIPRRDYELQMLFGMADSQKRALTQRGERLRIYMPFGELIPGMAYLVRRLLENTSNDSFLKSGLAAVKSPEELLRDPAEFLHLSSTRHSLNAAGGRSEPVQAPLVPQATNSVDSTCLSEPAMELSPFTNEPLADFAQVENRQRMQAAIAQVRGWLGRTWPARVAGRDLPLTATFSRENPSLQTEVIGHVASCTAEDAQQAVAAARAAQPAWDALGWEARAQLLHAIATELRRRRWELAAWQVLECGKPWREADGDVCEAIDFCEYYARGALLFSRPNSVDLPGEENRLTHIPLGVAAVIAPWNFPLAILCGMTVAALVTGNTVVMKPAEQASIVAAQFQSVLEAAGVPPGVVNFLPGVGEVVGRALVDHPDVPLIAFTGSRKVGLAIQARGAELATYGGRTIKRFIAELGGKNAIIVDTSADLDEAVLGVLTSAFGFAGQKCSACSRVIVVGDAYPTFVKRLVEGARSLTVGRADQPGTIIGPVIDAAAFRHIQQYIQQGQEAGLTAYQPNIGELAEQGHFIGPWIFSHVPPDSRLAQEEIFGPVLAVMPAANLTAALAIANDTDYALTGGIYTRSPANLERVKAEFQVGNLYINRPITGALVHRQPFGGYRMSGLGSKAGGPEYLYHFVLPRTITENTLRRGFAPTE